MSGLFDFSSSLNKSIDASVRHLKEYLKYLFLDYVARLLVKDKILK